MATTHLVLPDYSPISARSTGSNRQIGGAPLCWGSPVFLSLLCGGLGCDSIPSQQKFLVQGGELLSFRKTLHSKTHSWRLDASGSPWQFSVSAAIVLNGQKSISPLRTRLRDLENRPNLQIGKHSSAPSLIPVKVFRDAPPLRQIDISCISRGREHGRQKGF